MTSEARPLEGRVAIVTGASRGIGEYVARSLAQAGAKVAVAARTEEVSDPRLPGTIHAVAAAIKAEGGEAMGVRMDMRDADSIKEGVQKTVDTYGGLDIVVNNAAILVPGTLESVQERHLDLIWQIDLRGPLLLMKAALPHMKQAGRGHIVNVSSRAGVFPGPGPYADTRSGGAFYGMVKSGLERFSQGLAMELQGDNISVNVLSPQGRIKTPGNIFAENDRENPSLEFQEAWEMGKGTAWICQQGIEFTGHILFDQDLCREQGL
jgi:NAD(P)-dependent dehydrogenase (short-subunit alcohol dehydrogenase family)